MQFYEQQSNSALGSGGVTKYVRTLLILNCSVYIIQLLSSAAGNSRAFDIIFSASVPGIRSMMLWQPLTYMFLHGSPMHLLFNMIGLYMFGSQIEYVLGSRRFIRLYLFWGILAGIGWLAISAMGNRNGICLGASGAVLGLLGCYAGLYPEREISLIFPPITLKARTFVACLVVFSVLMMMDAGGGVAHSAHLFGCVAGYLYGMRIYKNPGLMDADLYRKANGNSFSQFIADIRAKIRRSTFTVVSHDEAPPTQEEIDTILDKVQRSGMKSLSIRERQALRRASEKQND